MKETKVQVLPAKQDDVPVIHNFISQLALFEKCPERVLATHDTIAKTLGLESDPTDDEVAITSTQLKPGQFAKCILAHVNGQKAGFAVFFYNYSTVLISPPAPLNYPRLFLLANKNLGCGKWLSTPGIFLEDLFVLPTFRSLGVGSALLSYLGRHAKAIGAGRLDWQVLKWNVGARKFYRETCGGDELEEWLGVRVEGQDKIESLIKLSQ
jgi:GNAT superfamily N-acetyltransferase